MPGINDVSKKILGPHYDEVSEFLSNNKTRLVNADMATLGDARRALFNENVSGVELKVLRARTTAVRSILDQGISVPTYYNTLINFYSTPDGKKLGSRLDTWARNPNVTEAEIQSMTVRVYNSARGGMQPAELAEINRVMDLQDNAPGTQSATAPVRAQPIPVTAAPPKKPAGGGRARTFTDDVNAFNSSQNSTSDEELFLRQKIERDKADGNKWTETEVAEELALMARLSKKGDQLTAAERASIVRPAQTSGDRTDDPSTDMPSDQPATAGAASAEPPTQPRYSPPDTLDDKSYDVLMTNMGDTLEKLMPEGMMGSNDAKGFVAKLDDPAFRARFIELYNSDPQYRLAIQKLYRDSTELAEMRGKRKGEIDPDSQLGARSELLQGQFRTLLGKPEDLLNVNHVMTLQRGVSGLLDFVKSPGAMLDQMPPWLKAFLAPVFELFQEVLGPLFTKQGMADAGQLIKDGAQSLGINMAGNGGGGLLGGLLGGGANAGAGSGALAPKVAAVDPLPKPEAAIKPDTPKPGMDAAPVNV